MLHTVGWQAYYEKNILLILIKYKSGLSCYVPMWRTLLVRANVSVRKTTLKK